MMVTGEQLETALPRGAANGPREGGDGAFGALVADSAPEAADGAGTAGKPGAGQGAPQEAPTPGGGSERPWRVRDLLVTAATMMGRAAKVEPPAPATAASSEDTPASGTEEISGQSLPASPGDRSAPILELEAIAEPVSASGPIRLYAAVLPPSTDDAAIEEADVGESGNEPATDMPTWQEPVTGTVAAPASAYALAVRSPEAESSREIGEPVAPLQRVVHTLQPIEVPRGNGSPAPARMLPGTHATAPEGAAPFAQAEPSRFASILSSVRTGTDDGPVVPINLGRAAFDAATQAVLQTHVERREQVPVAAGQLLYRADVAAILGHSTPAAGSAGTVAATPPAPPSDATPEARVTTHADAFVRDFGGVMARDFKAGHRWLDIRLDPAELGRIDVRMRVDHKGIVHAVIAADNASTFDLLRREGDTLMRSLQDAGVKADAGSLKFDLRSGPDQNGQQPSRQSSSQRAWNGLSDLDGGESEPAASTVRGYFI